MRALGWLDVLADRWCPVYLDRENFQDVRLVGHSYAAMIITGVGEQALPRLNRLIYVDAFVPSDGQSALSLFPEAAAERFRQQAESVGDGMAPAGRRRAPGFVGPEAGNCARLCAGAHVRLQPSLFSGGRDTSEERGGQPPSNIHCLRGRRLPCAPHLPAFRGPRQQRGWSYHELPTRHGCNVEMPDAFVSILLTGEGQIGPASASVAPG